MAFKFIVALAFVAVASAGFLPATDVYHAAQPVLAKAVESYDPHPQYQFSYAVNDAHTGDSKSQTETRDGDVVQGEYSLIDADGYKRTVQYAADSVHGFNAVVNREPLGHVVKAVAAAPVAYAAPTLIKSAPLAYAAAPSLIRSAPLGYASYAAAPAYTQSYAAAAPTLLRSSPVAAYSAAPAAYAAPTLIKSAPVAYAAAPSLIRSAPLGYASYAAAPAYTQTYAAAAPTLLRSSPVTAYSAAPATYSTQSIVRSAPIAYTAAPAYATAPAYAYQH